MPFPPLRNGYAFSSSLERDIIVELLDKERHYRVFNNYHIWGESYRRRAKELIEMMGSCCGGFGDPYVPFQCLNLFDRYTSLNAGVYEGNQEMLAYILNGCYLLALKERISMSQLAPFIPLSVYSHIEIHILQILDFKWNGPTPVSFIPYLVKNVVQNAAQNVAQIVAQNVLLEPHQLIRMGKDTVGRSMYASVNVLQYKPSVIAAAAILLQIQGHPHYGALQEQILVILQEDLNMDRNEVLGCFGVMALH